MRAERYQLDATASHADCRELQLRRANGTRRILLWPFDRPRGIESRSELRAVRLTAWARALRRIEALTIDPLTPRSSGTRIDIVPFQLAPAVAMASGTHRLLLADEVGLGKTIQAGWIVSDLLARDPDTRILLAVPAGLRHQWVAELSAGFGLEPSIVDARWLRDTVADLPADVSPWSAPGVYIGSIDFLKRPDVIGGIESTVWDLLVVDEAHAATAPTDRHAAIARAAAKSRRVILITATPYSGNRAGFASLLSIGATPASAPPAMFRRSRVDDAVGDPRQRRHRFARVRITAVEARFQRLLERYSRDVWNETLDNPDAARLAVTVLRKRALSSPAAAARSLRRRMDLLQGRARVPRQLPLFDDADGVDDDVASAALAAPGLADAAREHRCLAALIDAADAANEADSKLRYLRRLLDRLNGESLVVFTEYRDTLLLLAAALPPSRQLHGGLTAPERASVQRAFNRDGGLLLATDAAAEGLNLHQRCRVVVNYELPWNPARLEQRIGRVDRIGQRRTVHALTLTARDTAEDLVLRTLSRRLSRVVATLGTDDRLGAFLDDARTAGIVIGGEAVDDRVADVNDERLDIRAAGDLLLAKTAAEQIAARRSVETVSSSFGADVIVSNMRASGGSLEPGYAIVVRVAARIADGDIAGTRLFVLHVADPTSRPCLARDARIAAARAIERIDVHAALPEADAWFAEVSRAHAASVDAGVMRERELNPITDRSASQPGLFDRRVVAEAGRAAAVAERDADIHRREIDRLERSRALQLTCSVASVLILWR